MTVKYSSRLTLTGLPARKVAAWRVPEDVVDELIRATCAPRSLTAKILGDPLPGRSALDKMRMNQSPKLVPDSEGGR